ncbi:MAG TPA: MerR family transcriptional regulator [Luteibaculaceae bacterium]|nr:MerR family transcriptional regulator [Luteibaculaceae bacterium]
MSTFSIKDIESLTGIKSHTIRVWEQRYGLVQPKRSETNIRFYDDDDLRQFLTINILYQSGIKISKIADMPEVERQRLVYEITTGQANIDIQLQGLLEAMLELNEGAFNRIFLNAFEEMGMEHTMERLILPFLGHIGMLWQVGTIDPAYEHFVSCMVRHRLIAAIDRLELGAIQSPSRFLLFLPENEPHELGLLLAHYMIRSRGHHSIYLGANLPHRSLGSAVEAYRPTHIFCSATSKHLENDPVEVMTDLKKQFPAVHILFTGPRFLEHQQPPDGRITFIHAISQFRLYLEELASKL